MSDDELLTTNLEISLTDHGKIRLVIPEIEPEDLPSMLAALGENADKIMQAVTSHLAAYIQERMKDPLVAAAIDSMKGHHHE